MNNSGSRKMSNEDISIIRLKYNPSDRNWSLTGIAKQYGVSVSTVRLALLGVSYKHVPGSLDQLGQRPNGGVV